MNGLVTNITGALAEPERRRFWLTIGSGGLIAVGLIARYGFGMTDLRWALMVAAALLAGSDIALRAWRAAEVQALGAAFGPG
jgi:Zn2+/Cd2+-exporting ATPase